jgi:dTMP kinase
MRGRFITLEGIDGAGKSTVLPAIEHTIRGHGIGVEVTREPGGTAVGERLREMLLTHSMTAETEALVVFAARQEHLATVIEPALEAGRWVVCDRFTDATMAYQGAGRGIPMARLEILEEWVQRGRQPDLTLLFDLPAEVARMRRGAVRAPDRIEAEEGDFFERVRQGYLVRARRSQGRIRVIDGSASREDIQKEVEECVVRLCNKTI